MRAFGKQITKSTNKDACRDLSGRRIKTVNRDKKLKEFAEQQVERAKQKEEAKKEKRAKRKAELEPKRHMFNDPKYEEQKTKITQDLDDALNIALSSGDGKIETTDTIVPVEDKSSKDVAKTSGHTVEKFKDWMGVEIGTDDEDSEEEEEEPGPSKKKMKN